MPEAAAPRPPGTPCWVDLMVPDQRAALDFYCALFGWECEPGPSEIGGYAICTLNGRAVAGVLAPPSPDPGAPALPSVWTTYLATDDSEAAERAITRAGGSILMPTTDIVDLGRMVMAADPAGAVFGLWQAGAFTGAETSGEPGSVAWSGLSTSDAASASAFYRSALSLEAVPVEGAEGCYALNAGGRVVGGMGKPQGRRGLAASHWLVYFAVDDPDATVGALVRAGGTVVEPPVDTTAGRLAVVRDPQGAIFALLRRGFPGARHGGASLRRPERPPGGGADRRLWSRRGPPPCGNRRMRPSAREGGPHRGGGAECAQEAHPLSGWAGRGPGVHSGAGGSSAAPCGESP